MDLASMLEREDFFSSFFSTVQKYYKEVLNTEISFSFASNRKSCNMVIKPRLSAASSVHISKSAREFFYNEWNIRNSAVKNLIAKAYVFFMARTGKQLSQFRFTMIPKVDNIDDIIIAPNNRSIRFFDYESQTVGCMIKSGFTGKYFINQLEFRKSYSYSFMLPMLRWGEDWFVEPILKGHPLARITNESMYQKGITDALKGIRELAEDTVSSVDAEAYVSELSEKIKNLLIDAERRKKIKTAASVAKITENAVKAVKGTLKEIPTCESHGDFQGGNIWVDDNGKTWIYDWETAGRRSVWYDSAVLCYSLRRPYGWKELFAQLEPYKLLNCDSRKQYSKDEFAAIKQVVLMEDILFYLEDMLELPEDWGAALFDGFIERLTEIDEVKNAMYAR